MCEWIMEEKERKKKKKEGKSINICSDGDI
jgi:hypothetical protein